MPGPQQYRQSQQSQQSQYVHAVRHHHQHPTTVPAQQQQQQRVPHITPSSSHVPPLRHQQATTYCCPTMALCQGSTLLETTNYHSLATSSAFTLNIISPTYITTTTTIHP
ncbi:hypothetical protein Pelo_5181 [Pelomyxa schiedti]|nr:hypothetical protein Pelo_5181 [Pelomyxa schiedti]